MVKSVPLVDNAALVLVPKVYLDHLRVALDLQILQLRKPEVV